MKANLKKFLAPLTLADFNGASTKEEIKAKAESFLNSDAYKYNEKFEMGGQQYDIHNSLLCLIYDSI